MIADEIPTRNARASPLSDGQHLRLSAVRTKRVRTPQRWRMGLTKLANRLRIATLNVGSMTGKGRELADVLNRRRIAIACLQETRWKGSKAKELGDGYKLYYHGETC